jgi:hypothetical protein
MRLVAARLLVAIVIAACGPPAGELFRTALPTVDGDPLPVELGDSTGLVTAIEPADFDSDAVLEPLVKADPTEPNAFVLSWLGGLCDGEAALSFWRSETAFGLNLVVRGGPGLFGGCAGAGVPRGLRIKTSSPIAVDSIVVYGTG